MLSRPLSYSALLNPLIVLTLYEAVHINAGDVHVIGVECSGFDNLFDFHHAIFRKTARNFNLPAATCGKICVMEVEEIVEPGELDPIYVHTPGIYVDRLIQGTFEKRIEKRTVREG